MLGPALTKNDSKSTPSKGGGGDDQLGGWAAVASNNIINQVPRFGESLRGNRIVATGLRASERKSASERVSERVSEEGGFSEIFERF